MATDVVVASVIDNSLSVLLIRRTEWPEYGSWVLPGGFVRRDDRFDDAARRVLETKVSIDRRRPLTRLNFFDNPNRDPRTKVGSLAYLCLAGPSEVALAAEAPYRTLGTIVGDKVQVNGEYVELGFDHGEILAYACDEMRRRVQADTLWITPALSDDGTFTVASLNRARVTLGLGMTEDALRRRISGDGRVTADGWVDSGTGKPSRLYTTQL
ncbi:NUDIX domain-containing protein [Mycobacterium sp. SA01]|uniref:NUDIX domain-containing protein n=1 Tax=Mycobacterium sp. SA01 TaxID=3238820 RepID=UPI00351BAEC4